ncbi:MAG: AMP-binding protein [Actinobacteria bacterium]|nr:AMP-binding protein [Actinomycetota bacterium]
MPDYNIALLARAVAEAVPDRDYFVQSSVQGFSHGNQRLTYADMQDRARRFGRYLIDQGFEVRRERYELANHEIGQDALGLYLHNGAEFLIANLGCFEARVAPFNINYRYVAEELTYLLHDSGARGLVYHSTFAATLAEVLKGITGPQTLIQVPDTSDNPLLPGAVWFDDALAASDPDPGVDPTPDDLYMLYTGGTTGMPKGVLWRQADVYVSALGGRNRNTGDEWPAIETVVEVAIKGGRSRVMPLPPFIHGAGQWPSLTGLLSGHTIIVPEVAERLDPASILEAVEREAATTLIIVGDAFARPLCNAIEGSHHDLSSIAAFINSGAALHAETKARMLDLLPGRMIIDTLGSSETGSQAREVTTSASEARTGSFTATETGEVVDSTRTRFAVPGEDDLGWLAQRGRLPLGYLGDADKTALTFPVVEGERMAVAGDRAQLATDGTVILHGRDSVTINSGGEKIFAEEVEQALMRHPAVADVVVCGRPSERWGSEVCAVLACHPGQDPADDDLLAEAARHIARYKLPKVVVRCDEVYRSPSGKVDYRWAADQVGEA